ncbi:2Fe-2S iron-sulfur cluster binding domain-containing protein [Rhodoblastus sp. 17X3]|uniref:2Fe-2S iron-sulfur cluster binding domain-containing protein n=1 Tax=Rhodoblastus sp. 17X3 TaxID=3047026 RepID=UPI0024B68CF4|nr:2Fe-2S iron-sulfur cluster binding domain-containing protein [Rhodoblastus sp. 17X3]MDI9846585.1 2Fe-2S iron-sulfur cluster binding domain-containing protein [Rhodoblastus sp. 17X3]
MKHRIQIEGGDGFDVSADEDSLLRGALRAGVGFPYECGVGGCGNCRFDLVSGEMETLWPEAPGLSERERKRGKRLACQSRPLGDCVVRVRCADEYRPVVPTRRLQAVLTERREVAPGMAELTFTAPGPATFLPGQYAVFHPPGVEGPRAYSMSNLPNANGEWRFVVRRMPGGKGSNAMFDALAPGDALTIDGPYGNAYLREDNEREVVCVGGGSGVGPVVSVARAALKLGREKGVHIFEGARTRADLCVPALLTEREMAALNYIPVLSSEPEDSGWSGARGFVHAQVEQSLQLPVEHHEFYFAGPPPMIEAMQDLLVMRWKAPHAQIHFDKFF